MLNADVPREEITVTDNAKVTYDYNFKIYTDTDIVAYATAASAEPNDSTDSVVISAVTGVGEEDGGTITIPAMAVGTLLTIVSDIPTDRDVSYVTNGDFVPETVNDDFDKTLSIVKQIDATRRGLKFADAAQGVDDVSMPALEADKFLRVNSTADGIIYTEFPTTIGSVTSVSGDGVGGTASDPVITSVVSLSGDRVDASTSTTPVIKSTIIMAEENVGSATNIYVVDVVGADRVLPNSLSDLDGVICIFDTTHSNSSTCTLQVTGVLLSAYPLVDIDGIALSAKAITGTVICRFDNTSGGRWLKIFATEAPLPDDSVELVSLSTEVYAGVAKATGNIDPSDLTGAGDIAVYGIDLIDHNSTTKTTITLTSAMTGIGYSILASGMDDIVPKSCGAKILTSSTFELYNEAGVDSLPFVVYGNLA